MTTVSYLFPRWMIRTPFFRVQLFEVVPHARGLSAGVDPERDGFILCDNIKCIRLLNYNHDCLSHDARG